MTAPESPKAVDKIVQWPDRWSLWIPAVALLVVALFWWCVLANSFGFSLLVLLCGSLVTLGIVIMLVVQLVMRRFRAALSTLAAIAIMAGGFAVRLSILNLARYVDFAVHRAGYERIVEVWRAKHPNTVPFRLVLKDADASVFIFPTVFEYVVYDDSDAVGKDPPDISGVWLCAVPGWVANETMTMTMEPEREINTVTRLSGHFYFVEQVF
jgi:hypothetical protein